MHLGKEDDKLKLSRAVNVSLAVANCALLALLFVYWVADETGRLIASCVLIVVSGGAFVLACEFRVSQLQRWGRPIRRYRIVVMRILFGLSAIVVIGNAVLFVWLELRK